MMESPILVYTLSGILFTIGVPGYIILNHNLNRGDLHVYGVDVALTVEAAVRLMVSINDAKTRNDRDTSRYCCSRGCRSIGLPDKSTVSGQAGWQCYMNAMTTMRRVWRVIKGQAGDFQATEQPQ